MRAKFLAQSYQTITALSQGLHLSASLFEPSTYWHSDTFGNWCVYM